MSMSPPSPNPTVPSLQFPDLFNAALSEYSRKTGTDIATNPFAARFNDCNTSEAVLGILEEHAGAFNQFRRGNRKTQLIRWLKPTVDILLKVSTNDVVVQGISLAFPPANIIFSGIGLLLAAADKVSDSYNAIIELFQCFERYLGRLKVLTEIPSAVGEVSVKIMVELLEFLALATQQIKQGRFKKFAKSLLGENDVEAVLQRLDRLTTEESQITATQTMEVVFGLFKNMKEVMEDGKVSIDNIRATLVAIQQLSDNFNKMKNDQIREKIQKWLSPPDPSINHNTACDSHHYGSATWFLEGPIYNDWKARGSLLWTHGNPGSGKSVLCSSIIQDIESIRATGLASVAYYYFDFKDTGKQDRHGLLSSLLIQLCTQSNRGYDILLGLYEAHESGLRQPREDHLIRCLKDVLALPGHGRVYIIVDAMDESPNKPGIPSPREKVLQLMKQLVGLRHPDVRVCITSRPEVDIQMDLQPLASHVVSLHDEGGQKRDIIDYIRSVVGSDVTMKKWRPRDRQLVIDSLSQKANGMFRWVVCQLDTLRRCFPASIRDALVELPETLDETYEGILLRIDSKKREHAIRLFKCLAFSRRPLGVNELAEVFAIQFGTAAATTIPSLDTSLRPADASEAILLACSTLVTTIKLDDYDEYDDPDHRNSRVIQFSHYSVKEFLISERLANSQRSELSQYHIAPEPSHTVLAQSCISTLLQPDIHIGDTDGFPLAKYAARNWFEHVQWDGVASQAQIQDGMQRLFDPDKEHLAVWVSIYNIDQVPTSSQSGRPPNPSPLYYATLCGIESLVEYLVTECQQNPNESHGGWGTPLHAAAVLGHTKIAQFLLDHAADMNARNEHNSTPLHEASGSGNLKIAELLLSHGADLNALDHRGDSALRRAYQNQRLDAMELLVNGGANVNALTNSEATLLHEASGNGNLGVIQLLLRHDADANALDHWGRSPLHWAFQYQKIDAMNLLIKGGADANVRNDTNSTLLHEASGSGNLDAIQLLLSNEADVNVFDCWGDCPLHKAVRYQYAVELLVNGGADANVRNKSNSTPLHKASGSGNLNVMKLLLSHGADVNVLDRWGDSPFHRAFQYQKFDAMKLLVDGGADVNVKNKFNSTPLHEASGRGNLDAVQLLLNLGADVNALDHQGVTPIHEASRYQKIDAVKLLVGGGADVNVRDKSNSTLLHEASGRGNLNVMRLLLELGADVNALDHQGATPLHEASRYQNIDAVRLLVDGGADVNAQDKHNFTPLHEASRSGNLKIAELLLVLGANVNSLDHWGDSPLHKSLQSFRSDVVEPSHKGVKVTHDTYDWTLIRTASSSGNIDLVPPLSKKDTGAMNASDNRRSMPLHDAPQGENYAMARLLLTYGADVNARGWRHKNPLHLALSEGHGVDIDAHNDDN